MKTDWKLSKCGEYEIYYVHFLNKMVKENSDNSNKKKVETPNNSKTNSKKIRIISEDSRKRSAIIGIILANNNNVIGASEIHIMEDNNAEISMLSYWKDQIELPENLKSQAHKFERHEGIFVEDDFKGKGYGTDLMKIILTYLKTIHINKLEIHGITQHGAINFYKKTGAQITDFTTAEYDVVQALKLIKLSKDNKRNFEIEI